MASKKGKLLITLVRSPVGCRPEHRGTVRALGLKKWGRRWSTAMSRQFAAWSSR